MASPAPSSAATTASTAVAGMVQRASQNYLECRRTVTAKVEEVKALDEQIAAVFEQITALAGPSRDEDASEEEKEAAAAAAKSVGRLEVTLAGVEGEAPVAGATLTVSLDPEYEADEFETVEEVVEKKDVVVTDEDDNVVEEGAEPPVHEDGTPHKLKTTTKTTRTILKKRVKKEKVAAMRTVAWDAGVETSLGEEAAEKPLVFPATFVFDPVQSREAIMSITLAAPASDDQDVDAIKEIEIPVSSLFQSEPLDRWYSTLEEEEEDVPTTITELEEEEPVKTEEPKADEPKTEEPKDEEPKDEEPKTEENKAEENKAEEAKTEENKTEAEEMEEPKTEEPKEGEEAAADKTEETEEPQAEAAEEKKPEGPRFHVKASFVLSEAEKLSVSAVKLSKQKQEAESALSLLEREAASLRTKYERLNASQRSVNASSVSKPKASLLGGRFGTAAPAAPRKTQYQQLRESVGALFTPQRQQVMISFAIFFGSAAVFHFQGENLLV